MVHDDTENQGAMVVHDNDGHVDPIDLAEQGMQTQNTQYHVLTQNIRYRLVSAVPVDGERRRKVWLIPTIAIILIVIFGIAVHKNNCPQLKAMYDSNNESEIDNEPKDYEDTEDYFDCFPESFGRFSLQDDPYTPLGIDEMTAIDVGGYYEPKLVEKPWILFTSVWLHINIFQLIANIAALLVVGILLERKFGWALIGIIYILSGFGGAMLAHYAYDSKVIVCSSGPIMGLVGAMLSELFTNWSLHKNKTARFILVVSITVVFSIFIGDYTLLGGGLVGFLLGLVLLPLPRPQNTESSTANPTRGRERYHCCQVVSGIVALIVLILMLVIMLALMISHIQFLRSDKN